ncbi:MAG TPA: hypothetical protein VMU89_10655 [Thermomicrobiaceae bacterium]|nr:hypothetical protein [Thermomicrobiaceae bacterium]
MGSSFDDLARKLASDMPRRKVFKLFAGGLAAAIGTAILGAPAAAQSGQSESVGSDFFPGFNGTIPCHFGFNGKIELHYPNLPSINEPPVSWPPEFLPFPINRTFPPITFNGSFSG